MKIPGAVYDKLKWILMIVVPAFVTMFKLFANTWMWDIPVDNIANTITGIAAFLGVVVGISSYNLKKEGEQ